MPGHQIPERLRLNSLSKDVITGGFPVVIRAAERMGEAYPANRIPVWIGRSGRRMERTDAPYASKVQTGVSQKE